MPTDAPAPRPTSSSDPILRVASQLIPERRVEIARELGLTGAAAAAPGPAAPFADAVRRKGLDEKQLIGVIGIRELKQVAHDLGVSAMGFDRAALEREVLALLDPSCPRQTRMEHVPVERALPTDLTRLSLEKRADDLQQEVDRLTRAHRFVLGLGAFGFGLGLVAKMFAHGTMGMPFYLAVHFLVCGVLIERFDLSIGPSAILFGLAVAGCAMFLIAYSLPGALVTLCVIGAAVSIHRRQRADMPV